MIRQIPRNSRDRKTELKLALVAIFGITLFYALYARDHSVRSSSLVGHGIGIAGFALMLATESLYSIRKRWGKAHWGRLSQWLSSHIFMGIVGPYMVFLHTAWRFRGLAGLTLFFTFVVVLSGFVGRYIYTSIHKGLAASELQEADLAAEVQALNQQLNDWLKRQPPAIQDLVRRDTAQAQALAEAGGAGSVFAQTLDNWLYQWRLQQAMRRLPASETAHLRQLRSMLRQRRQLARQSATLAQARRLMSTWHVVHVPLGMVLFTAAFLHVIFALFYSTFSY